MQPYLSIIGLTEAGIEALCPTARQRLQRAKLVIGGLRHLALAEPLINNEKQVWSNPIHISIDTIIQQKSKPIVALASGDPFWYGVGPLITRHLKREEWESFPGVSGYSLAHSQLGWRGQDTITLSLCGRPIETLRRYLTPFARLLILSADGQTPYHVKNALKQWNVPTYRFHLLEALGGINEHVRCFSEKDCLPEHIHPLNMIALELDYLPFIPAKCGLEDHWFSHDGKLTKQNIRAATLSALQPFPGGLLWDIGTGSGSIAIEWTLAYPTCQAIAIEHHHIRAKRAMENARTLGVPGLKIIEGEAPYALENLPEPDAVFIGGGSSSEQMIQTVWKALKPKGRLVINAVTSECEMQLLECYKHWGGTLTRLHTEHYEPMGKFHGFRPTRTITQYAVTKSV
ncbi:MAG: precorrin-6y C5,15-methyltransferase (decarboxylating) subunit CbiE [Commensalibacter sp.]